MKQDKYTLNRRDFIKGTVVGLTGLSAANLQARDGLRPSGTTKVALVQTDDRVRGVKTCLDLFNYAPVRGKKVYIKPNFNTADPTPGSTHNDTLGQLVKMLHDQGAAEVSVGDRSGPQPTAEVLQTKKLPALASDLDFRLLNFSELGTQDWVLQHPEGIHWQDGFLFARPALEAEYTVSTCCLKTHQYGGVFTMSLKLSVGLVPRKQMRELHNSPAMRKMIAEINLAYRPQLILMDGIEAFVDGGPMEGTRKQADVFLAGDDRVAVDAVGLAVLKELGANEAIMGRGIFAQEQIQRAAELDIGIRSPEQIEFVTEDRASRNYGEKLRAILAKG
jgi:uncharacterized protein (DUF362 family)